MSDTFRSFKDFSSDCFRTFKWGFGLSQRPIWLESRALSALIGIKKCSCELLLLMLFLYVDGDSSPVDQPPIIHLRVMLWAFRLIQTCMLGVPYSLEYTRIKPFHSYWNGFLCSKDAYKCRWCKDGSLFRF